MSAKIRILHALTTSQIGGTEQMVLKLASELNGRNFACDLSVIDDGGPIMDLAISRGIRVHKISASAAYLGAVLEMYQLLRREEYDIVQMYGFRVSAITRLASCGVKRRPIIVHGIRGLHLTESEDTASLRTRIALRAERLMERLVDVYISNSHSAAAFLASVGIPSSKIVVIENGIDPTEWSHDDCGERQERTVICVANLKPIKRQRDLIEAVRELRRRDVDVRCLLVGDGPDREGLMQYAARLVVQSSVEFLGHCSPERVKQLLGEASLFVLPSLWEGMPVSMMEAMAAGLPVVGTNVPGIRELVLDGVTGCLVAPRTPRQLADCIQTLLQDRSLRRNLGRAGRVRICREFSLKKMVDRYEETYHRLLSRGGDRQTLLA